MKNRHKPPRRLTKEELAVWNEFSSSYELVIALTAARKELKTSQEDLQDYIEREAGSSI